MHRVCNEASTQIGLLSEMASRLTRMSILNTDSMAEVESRTSGNNVLRTVSDDHTETVMAKCGNKCGERTPETMFDNEDDDMKIK